MSNGVYGIRCRIYGKAVLVERYSVMGNCATAFGDDSRGVISDSPQFEQGLGGERFRIQGHTRVSVAVNTRGQLAAFI